jgi:hypothetical protein
MVSLCISRNYREVEAKTEITANRRRQVANACNTVEERRFSAA